MSRRGKLSGVIADERLTPFDDRSEHAAVYVSSDQSPTPFPGLVVRVNGDLTGFEEPLRQAVSSVDIDQALTDIKSVEQLKTESLGSDRLRSALFSAFAILGLLLSGIGVYGVISYSVVQRTLEIGIRAALGATESSVRRLVLGRGLALTTAGIVFGLIGSAAATKLLNTFLFGVSRFDVLPMAVSVAMLLGVACVACYVPARAATRIDATTALRAE